MTGKTGRPEVFEELRRRAEQIVERRGKGDAPADSEELLRLLHEIEVYQVEVELQNEELRRTARELRNSRDEYFDLFEFAPVGFVVLDRKGRIKRANAAAAEILGEDAAWLEGRFLWERIYASDQREFFSWFRRMADDGCATDSIDLRMLGKAGTICHVRLDAKAIRGEASRLKEWRIAISDITGRKRAEQELARQSELLGRIIENIPVLLVMWDPLLERFTLNRHAESVLGWTTEEANEGDFMSKVYPDAAYRAEVSSYMKSLESGWREWIATTKDGEKVPVDWANIRLSDDTLIGIGVDLRERKMAEKALRESEALYRAVAKNFPDGAIYVFDHDLRFRVADGTAMEKLGLTREGLEGRTIWEAVDEQTCSILEKRYPRVLAGESLHYETELKGRIFSSDYVPIRDENGNVIAGMVVSKDITERKRAEQALAESESRFRTMADGLPLIVWVHDAEGRLKFVNQTFCEFFGVSENEAGEEGWKALIHSEDGPAYAEEFFACVRDKRPFNAQVRVKRADGRWRYIESWGRPRFSSEGEFLGFVGTSADIHDRKLAEEALKKLNDSLEQRVAERTALAETRTAQLQKLALELSNAEDREREKIALVLHDDLQQYLAAIRFHLQMLLPEDADCEKTGEQIRKVERIVDESIQKCRSLSHDLSPPVLRQFGFLAALEWLAEDMKDKHGFHVAMKTQKGVEPESRALASVLFRSVRELLFNSVKHSGGDSAAVEALHEGGRIIVRIKDQGKGCDPEEFKKETGTGKGFGLLSIQERISFLDGRCEIESAPGDGFRVILEVPKHGKTKREKLESKVPEEVGGQSEDIDLSQTWISAPETGKQG